VNNYETQLYKLLGSFWTRLWQEPDLISGLVSAFAAIDRDLDYFADTIKDYLSRADIPINKTFNYRHILVKTSELKPVSAKVGEFTIGSSFITGQPFLPLKWECPITYTDASLIVDSISNPRIVYCKNQDFIIKDGYLIFFSNPALKDFNTTARVNQDGTVDIAYSMWLLSAKADTGLLRDIFGATINWNTPSSRYAKNLLNRMWDLLVQGATIKNIVGLLCAIVDADICEADGVITEVWTEANRNFVAIGNTIYSAPSRFTHLKAVGDTVKVGDQLFDVVKIYSGSDDIPSNVFLGLCVDSSLTNAAFKDGLIFVNKEVDLDYAYVAGDPNVVVLSVSNDIILIQRNGVEESVLTNTDLINTGIVKIPIFDIGGDEKAVTAYRHHLAHQCWKLGIDLYSQLTKSLRMPYKINPMKFVQDCAFGYNMLFIAYSNPAEALSVIADKCLRLLDETVPAGTSFLLFQGSDDIVDNVTASNIKDSTIISFLAGATADVCSNKVSDKLKFSSKQY